ncbi:hypothetical protein HG531_010246 [Fusarium graminearum]|nr:hypothetical protein HG531_010246 [Fusarium graminearum]
MRLLGGELTGLEGGLVGVNVRVHAQAHTATSLSPLETGIDEDLIETLLLGLSLDKTRARNDHGALDVISNLAALDNIGSSSQILNSGVGAGSDENLVDGNILHGGSSGQAHVLKHATTSSLLALAAECFGVRNAARDGYDVFRTGSPGKSRNNILSINEDIDIILGTGIRLEGLPVGNSVVPSLRAILGGQGATLEIFKGDLIGSDHTSTGATLNGHVADGHASLHAQAADNRTTELNNSTSTSSSTNLTDGMENNVL